MTRPFFHKSFLPQGLISTRSFFHKAFFPGCVCPALELIRMKYLKILTIDKSELLIDQLSRVLTHMNVNMVINFIFDLWQERKSKLYC